MRWKKPPDSPQLQERVLAVLPPTNFSPPALVTVKPLQAGDYLALQSLTQQLQESGVIEREVEERAPQSPEELHAMVSEAVALAKSERELNPAYYDPQAEALLGERDLEAHEDWANPDLPGGEGFGAQEGEDYPVHPRALVRLPDGSVTVAEIL